MPGSVLPGETAVTYRETHSVSVREDAELGRRWGMKPGTAHQMKLRVARYAADVIEVKRFLGAEDSLTGWVQPITNALEHRPRPVENAELRAALADCDEDQDEARYRANPSEGTARALLRKRALERQTSLDHDRQIAAKWGITL